MEKKRSERKSKMFWKVFWPLAVIIIFGGVILSLNGCGGGGGGTKADNSNQNNPPPADNNTTTPPSDSNNTNPPPDIKTAGLIQLPKTGQKISYAKGDDGDIQAGASWPSTRFIDNGNNTFTDNLTGLMWMKKPAQNKITSLAAASYVDKVNRGLISTGTPFIDWRIPSVYELRSVNDFGKNDAAILIKYSPDIKDEFYWTSSTLNVDTYAVNPKSNVVQRLSSNYYYYFTDTIGRADLWLVRGLSTGQTAVPKTGQTKCFGPEEGSTHPVNCGKRIGWIVQEGSSCYYKWSSGSSEHAIEIPCNGARQDGQYQAGIAWPDPRFVNNGDTVTDKLTGLMWTKNSRLRTDATWQQALDYVNQMNKDKKFGYSDWHLPNINELFSVIDCSGAYAVDGCSIYPIFGVDEGSYWSSTTYAGDINLAWYWRDWLLDYGVSHRSKTEKMDVWPVRTVPAK